MDFDSLRAQVQLRGDFFRAFALADQLEHFEFAVRELLDRRTASPRRPEKISRIFADIFSLTYICPLRTWRIACLNFLPPSCFMT